MKVYAWRKCQDSQYLPCSYFLMYTLSGFLSVRRATRHDLRATYRLDLDGLSPAPGLGAIEVMDIAIIAIYSNGKQPQLVGHLQVVGPG